MNELGLIYFFIDWTLAWLFKWKLEIVIYLSTCGSERLNINGCWFKLGHLKGDVQDLAPDLEGHVIVDLDLGPGIDADTLLSLGHKKDVNVRGRENAGQKAFHRSSQKLLVVSLFFFVIVDVTLQILINAIFWVLSIFLVRIWIFFVCAQYLMNFRVLWSWRYYNRYYAFVKWNTKMKTRYFRKKCKCQRNTLLLSIRLFFFKNLMLTSPLTFSIWYLLRISQKTLLIWCVGFF